MGDSIDGSTRAAQSAQMPNPRKKSGFLTKLSSLFSSTPSNHPPQTGALDQAGNQSSPSMSNLRKLRVEDVMIPKSEIVSAPSTITQAPLIDMFRESGLTRLPVYNETLDSPIGLIHLKDFALNRVFTTDTSKKSDKLDLKKLIRPLLFAPPSMPIGILLQKMQTDRIHMALVIDEYGGVDGLVTIEDLIEQVIGEIEDEHDTEDGALWQMEKPGCYLAEAKTPLDEFAQATGIRLNDATPDEAEIDTLGGLVSLLSGHVPARGQVIKHRGGVEFEVVDADPRRIKRLRVRLPHPQNSDDKS